MRKIILLILFLPVLLFGQTRSRSSIGDFQYIDSTTGDSLTVDVTDSVFTIEAYAFRIDSVTTTQRDALTAVNGMVVYNHTDNQYQAYANAAWINLGAGAAGGETNTFSSLGGTETIIGTKAGVDLPHKGFTAGTNITLSSDANSITINSTGGGSQTPWTTNIDADGFDLQDLSNIEFRTTTGAPASSIQSIWADAGGINLNVPSADIFDFLVNGVSQFSLSGTGITLLGDIFHNTDLDIKIDADNNSANSAFRILDGASNIIFRLQETGSINWYEDSGLASYSEAFSVSGVNPTITYSNGIMNINSGTTLQLDGGSTLSDGQLLDLSAVLHDDVAIQGIIPPHIGASPVDPTSGEGYFGWDQTNKVFKIYDGNEWEIIEASGLMDFFRINEAGGITLGQIVYFSGATGNNPEVSISSNDDPTTSDVFGMALQSGADNATILVVWSGHVDGLNTSAFSDGDLLFLGLSGAVTNIHPTSTNDPVPIGRVSRSHATLGVIQISINNGNVHTANFAGTARQIVRNLSTDASALVGYTAINSTEANFATYGLHGINHPTEPNALSIFSHTPGIFVMAIDDDQPFVWKSDFGGVIDFTSFEIMRLTSDGKLGIGDTDPDAKLEIISTTTPQLIITHTDGIDDLRFSVDANGDVIVAATGGDISFSDENLTTTGNIAGVNVTSGANPGHTHTGSSLSSIDISDDTNLSGGTNATLNGDAIDVDDAFVINSGSDVMAGILTADGLTLGANENITLGAQTLDHDGTNFVFNDQVNATAFDAADGNLTNIGTIALDGLLPDGTDVTAMSAGGNFILGGGATASNLRLLEASGSGTNYTEFVTVPQAANITYTLPPDDGDAGEQLQTDGNGVWTWEAAGSGTGAFSDAGDPVVLNTTTKDVHMGDGAGTLVGKFEIGGDADQPQFVIEQFSTQTDDPFIIQLDNDTEQFSISPSPSIFLREVADAPADKAAYGQIWVNTATPNELTFTDDAGTDQRLTGTIYREVWTPAGGVEPSAGDLTAPTALAADPDNANDVTVSHLEFSASAENYITVEFPLPGDWDGSTAPKFRITAYSESTHASNTAEWVIAAKYIRDGTDTWLGALGTAATATQVYDTADNYETTTVSPTPGGTASGADSIILQMSRDGDDGTNDTFAGTTRFVKIGMQYVSNTFGASTW